nr:GGDEF domain-containing protein [Salidesulfovibrio onnuriiensis]
MAHYQSIVDFQSGAIHGWEASSGGAQDGELESPLRLFEIGAALGRLFELETHCFKTSVKYFNPRSGGQKLFINVHPDALLDLRFSASHGLEMVKGHGLEPGDVVLEITSQSSFENLDVFKRKLASFRKEGFLLSIDNVSIEDWRIRLISELQPDYIKLGSSLVGNVHKDQVKRALVEAFAAFVRKINAKLICKNIETREQLLCLMHVGVEYGQGLYLDYPDQSFKESDIGLDLPVTSPKNSESRRIPIEYLTIQSLVVSPQTTVRGVQALFRQQHVSCIVVADRGKPKGLITEHRLFRKLASLNSSSIEHQSISAVMDDMPLIVDVATPVELAAQLAMEREPSKLYEEIIVVREEEVLGTVPVHVLMNARARIQVEAARDTNPLTGLPGNKALEHELNFFMKVKPVFSIIYADLDNFKVYNDAYGFINGDRLIKQAAKTLVHCASEHGSPDVKVCHIGGDDFVIITADETVEPMCAAIQRRFQRDVQEFYSDEDRSRGWTLAKGRDGVEREYPLVTISMGAVQVGGSCSLMEIGERAAHVKKFAKSYQGQPVSFDRRGALGTADGKRAAERKN